MCYRLARSRSKLVPPKHRQEINGLGVGGLAALSSRSRLRIIFSGSINCYGQVYLFEMTWVLFDPPVLSDPFYADVLPIPFAEIT